MFFEFQPGKVVDITDPNDLRVLRPIEFTAIQILEMANGLRDAAQLDAMMYVVRYLGY